MLVLCVMSIAILVYVLWVWPKPKVDFLYCLGCCLNGKNLRSETFSNFLWVDFIATVGAVIRGNLSNGYQLTFHTNCRLIMDIKINQFYKNTLTQTPLYIFNELLFLSVPTYFLYLYRILSNNNFYLSTFNWIMIVFKTLRKILQIYEYILYLLCFSFKAE